MTRFLYLVRHGEASPHDGPLSPAGQEQAQLTGQRLKDVPFSAVYHGLLPRAAQTAELIAPPRPRPRPLSPLPRPRPARPLSPQLGRCAVGPALTGPRCHRPIGGY